MEEDEEHESFLASGDELKSENETQNLLSEENDATFQPSTFVTEDLLLGL